MRGLSMCPNKNLILPKIAKRNL